VLVIQGASGLGGSDILGIGLVSLRLPLRGRTWINRKLLFEHLEMDVVGLVRGWSGVLTLWRVLVGDVEVVENREGEEECGMTTFSRERWVSWLLLQSRLACASNWPRAIFMIFMMAHYGKL
jgi:hypothetical protein